MRYTRFRVAAVLAVLVVLAGVVYGTKFVHHRWVESQARAVFDDAAATVTTGDEVIATPKHPNGGLVVYAHGSGQTAESIRDRDHAHLMADLLNAGYVVASSDAAGNAWGNPASVQDYVDLVTEVRNTRKIGGVFVIGESMGGLPSLQLLDRISGVQAWVGIFPVTDARTVDGAEATAAVAPVAVRNTGVPLLMFASPDDTRVPKAQNADVFAATMRAKGATVSVVSTRGNHGDPSNFDSARIVEFFSRP